MFYPCKTLYRCPLIICNDNFNDHINKPNKVFNKLKESGFKINADISFFAKDELEYLDFKITRNGIISLPDAV